MAIKPNENDVFLREVDEELRKERINRFVARYGWWILAAILLVLGAIGGAIWWQERQRTKAAEQGVALLEALESLEAGNRKAAAPALAELGQSGRDGYRAAALFAQAALQAESGDPKAAVATLKKVAEDKDLAAPYREAALVRQTMIEFDTLQPQVVVQRLDPLAKPGQPWFGTAGEMVAVAQLKMGKAEAAGQLFARIARDETVPPTIRTRAVQMAGSLGVNAMPEGAAAGDANKAAAAREESE